MKLSIFVFFCLCFAFFICSRGEQSSVQSWWNSLAAVANFKMAFEQAVEDQQIFDEGFCDELFHTPTQRRVCRANVAAGNAGGLVTALDSAVRLALRECKEQFKTDRWNCPLEWDPALWSDGFSPESVTFLQQGTKESAFLMATISAALTHTVAYACSIGNLTDCSCQGTSQNGGDNPIQLRPTTPETTTAATILSKSALLATSATSTWQWGGCSENVQFGSFVSRKFLDPPALERIRADANDLLALVQLQNLQFGRKTLTSQLRVNCRCHGLSASCSVKTCFRQPSPFRQVAVALREKYERALLASDRPELKAVAIAASSVVKPPRLTLKQKQQQTTQRTETVVDPFDIDDQSAGGDDNSLIRNRLMRRKAKDETKQSFIATSTKSIMAFLRNDAILRDNLIHFKKSPNFCEPTPEWPHGTRDRVCAKPPPSYQAGNLLSERLGMLPATSEVDNINNLTNLNNNNTLSPCSTLCCGRGYNTKLVYVAESCRCVFKWCCEIKCETCWTTKEVHTCK